MTERRVSRMPSVSEEEARAILARHGMPWDGPITVHQPRTDHTPGRAMDFNATPEQYDRLRSYFAEATTKVFEQIRDTMASMGIALDPGEEHDDDSQVRALALRRNRNTGPARPSGQNVRRPRKH